MNPAINEAEFRQLLDQTWSTLRTRPDVGMELLITKLSSLRKFDSTGKRTSEVTNLLQTHRLWSDLQSDPLTNRSFNKPRGYSGDAIMLDMIYSPEVYVQRLDGVAADIFQYTAKAGRSPKAVRYRRDLIAEYVDRIAAQKGRPIRVLSIASGHLREASLSTALKRGDVAEWLALDQDIESLSECAAAYAGSAVVCRKVSVRQLLLGKTSLKDFDFVYAAGLLDYLDTPVAAALLDRMIRMTNHEGGIVLVANFADTHIDAGYMEDVMDWHLTYRSSDDMLKLIKSLSHEDSKNYDVFSDPFEAILYGLIAVGQDQLSLLRCLGSYRAIQ